MVDPLYDGRRGGRALPGFVVLPDLARDRRIGTERTGGVGGLHHHLRVLGRYRALRHADLGDPLPFPRALAAGDLPRVRGDDRLRGHDSRAVPPDPRRPRVARVLAGAVSERALPVAELQVTARLGRLRHHDLLHRFGGLLLPGHHPGSRRGARPCAGSQEEVLPDHLAGLARDGPRVAPLLEGVHLPGGPRHAPGALCALGGVVGLRNGDRAGMAHHDLRTVLRVLRW